MKNKEVRPSLLDRLLGSPGDHGSGGYYSMYELRESVQRDLQNLLNTRIRFLSTEKHLKLVQGSVFNYGLPDLTSQQLQSNQGRLDFAEWIERSIKRFEPRFKKVTVTPSGNPEASGGLSFRVDAVLYADPAPEDVSFDSTIDPLNHTVVVNEARP